MITLLYLANFLLALLSSVAFLPGETIAFSNATLKAAISSYVETCSENSQELSSSLGFFFSHPYAPSTARYSSYGPPSSTLSPSKNIDLPLSAYSYASLLSEYPKPTTNSKPGFPPSSLPMHSDRITTSGINQYTGELIPPSRTIVSHNSSITVKPTSPYLQPIEIENPSSEPRNSISIISSTFLDASSLHIATQPRSTPAVSIPIISTVSNATEHLFTSTPTSISLLASMSASKSFRASGSDIQASRSSTTTGSASVASKLILSSVTSTGADSARVPLTTVISGDLKSSDSFSTAQSTSARSFSFTSTGTDSARVPITTAVLGSSEARSTSGQLSRMQSSIISLPEPLLATTITGTKSAELPPMTVIAGSVTLEPGHSSLSQSSISVQSFSPFITTSTGVKPGRLPITPISPSNTTPSSSQASVLIPIELTSVGIKSDGTSFTTLIEGGFFPTTNGGLPPTGNSALTPFPFSHVSTNSHGGSVTDTLVGFPQPSPGFTLVQPSQSADRGSILGFPSLRTIESSITLSKSSAKSSDSHSRTISSAPIPSSLKTAHGSPVSGSPRPTTTTPPSLPLPAGTHWTTASSTQIWTATSSKASLDLASAIVTSTITTSPSGFSVETTSRSDWTKNTVLTTTDSHGHTTVLPVIVGCPFCGGLDFVLWNLPDLVNIEWKILGFPKLPFFHIPCLMFCHKGSGGEHGPPEPPILDPPEDKTTAKEPSSTSSSSASSSSSSSSSSASISSTYYTIIPNPSAAAPFLNDFTARLKSETDPDTLYLSGVPALGYINAWTQFLNSTQVSAFKLLSAVAAITTGDVLVTPVPDILNKTAPAISHKRGFQPRRKLHEKRLLEKRNTQYIQQTTNRDELKVISAPRWFTVDNLKTYAYLPPPASPPQGRIMVYAVDSGANKANTEYIGITGTKFPFIFAGRANDPSPETYNYDTIESDWDTRDAHGSCVLSKVVGPNWGVSKNSDVTVVKLPPAKFNSKFDAGTQNDFPYGSYRLHTVTDALVRILADVNSKGLGRRAVVAMAWGVSEKLGHIPQFGEPSYRLYDVMRRLIERDVVLVTASGNDAEATDPALQDSSDEGSLSSGSSNGDSLIQEQISDIPALWNSVLPIIVVGATNNHGLKAAMTQFRPDPAFPNSRVDVWAPGTQVACAGNRPGATSDQTDSGTSVAAGTVAGLVAYFMSDPGIWYHSLSQPAGSVNSLAWATTVRNWVVSESYSRYNVPTTADSPAYYPPMVYNGAIPFGLNGQPVCPAAQGLNGKRQEPGCSIKPTSPSQVPETQVSVASVTPVASAHSHASATLTAGPCIQSSLVDCIYQYSTAPPGQPCPKTTALPLPASCGPTSRTTAAPPLPPTTLALAPEATCTAVGRLINIDCAIWTNFVTETGDVLLAAVQKSCGSWSKVTKWSGSTINRPYKASDGTAWTADKIFQFTLVPRGVVRQAPSELDCIRIGIIAAGGPKNLADCGFAPLLSPP